MTGGKAIPVEDAVGAGLAHDITEIRAWRIQGQGASDEDLDELFRHTIVIKPAGHRLKENYLSTLSAMSMIGG